MQFQLLHVAGLARAFAGAAVGALGKGLGVGQPEVAAGRPAAITGRETLAQSTGPVGGSWSKRMTMRMSCAIATSSKVNDRL